jgi:hypothetical protein
MSSTGEMRIEGSPPDSRAIIEATERLCPLVAMEMADALGAVLSVFGN